MENSTSNSKESIELSWTLMDNYLGGRKRLTRGLLRKLNELNEQNEQDLTGLTNRASRFSNSVLILENTAEQVMLPDEETNSKDDQDASVIELQKEKNTEQALMIGKERNSKNCDQDASIIECSKLPLPLHHLSKEKKNNIEQVMIVDEKTNASIIVCSEPTSPLLQLSLKKKKKTIKQARLPDNETNKRDIRGATIIERSKPFLRLHRLEKEKKNNIKQAILPDEETNSKDGQDASFIELQKEKNNTIDQTMMIDEETNASIIECSEPTLSLQQISQKQKNNIQQVVGETNNKNDQDASIIECSKSLQQKPCLFVQEVIAVACPSSQKQSKNFKRKKRKQKSLAVLESDSSDDDSTGIQKSSVHKSIQSSNDGENIAPQKEDDIIELWSNLKTNKKKKDKKRESNDRNRDRRKARFVVDTKPDLKNLDFLNTEPTNKKQKLHHQTNKVVSAKQHNNIYLDIESTKTQPQKYKKQKKKNCSTLNEASSSTLNPTSTGNSASTSTLDRSLREIVVDGSNVARAFTHNEGFGEKGIQLVVDYFMSKGHVVKVFLPQYIQNKKYKFLEKMYKKGVVVYTPSRKILGRQITPYDDRFILEYATLCDGVVVSADQYRDLYDERPDWRDTILNRLLTPTFVGNCVLFPDDPLGRFGPDLYTFLRH